MVREICPSRICVSWTVEFCRAGRQFNDRHSRRLQARCDRGFDAIVFNRLSNDDMVGTDRLAARGWEISKITSAYRA